MLSINTEMGYIAAMMSPLSSGMEGSAMRIAQYGRDTLVEGLPELLKVLKDVAAIHPFIQGKPAGQGLLSVLLLKHSNI